MKPERTRKKARSETRIQLDRYNNLSKCALTKSSQKRPEWPWARRHMQCKRIKRPDDTIQL